MRAGRPGQVRSKGAELTYARHARQDVDVAVDDGDGDPEVVAHEDGLGGEVAGLVGRQLDHAHARRPGRRLDVPAEVRRLLRPVLAEPLHALEGLRVELQLQAEGLGDRRVRDVVVSVVPLFRLRDHGRCLFCITRQGVRQKGKMCLRRSDSATAVLVSFCLPPRMVVHSASLSEGEGEKGF